MKTRMLVFYIIKFSMNSVMYISSNAFSIGKSIHMSEFDKNH